MADPLVVRVMRAQKEALLAREYKQMSAMAGHWLSVERELKGQIDALAEEVAREKAVGKEINQSKLYRLGRYQELLMQLRGELDKYNRYSVNAIRQGQMDWMKQGLDDATQAVIASYGKMAEPWFARLPVEAVETMAGLAGDGSPLRSLLDMAYGDAAQGLTEALIRGTALGWNPRKTASVMTDGLAQGLGRELTIARTEQIRVYREAGIAQYERSGVVEGFVRLVAHDVRTCLACLAREGEFYPLNRRLEDHPNGRCLTPGSFVAGPPIEAFIARRYWGEVLTIRLASGQFITITPNHPILTDRGWMTANLLRQGDNVICGRWQDGAALGMRPDKDDMPTLIEQIPSALGMNRFASVPASAEDFHGDGVGSDVYVVWANSLLGGDDQASFAQPSGQYFFGKRNAEAQRLASLGDLAAVLERLMTSARGLLSYSDAAMMFFYRRLFGQQLVSQGLIAQGNACGMQTIVNQSARDTERLSKGIFRFTSQITRYDSLFGDGAHRSAPNALFGSSESILLATRASQPADLQSIKQALGAQPGGALSDGFSAFASNISCDSVVEIGVRAFSGHVYNLKTGSGWYIAGSSISSDGRCVNAPLVHNCSMVPKVVDRPAPQFTLGVDWFHQQSPETQERMMGAKRYAAWRDGKFDFERLAQTVKNDTWGDGVRVATLKELVK